MKRSKMIVNLANYLDVYGLGDDWTHLKVLSDNVLKFLEQQGMLPPHNRHAQRFDLSSQEGLDHSIMSGYKWEDVSPTEATKERP